MRPRQGRWDRRDRWDSHGPPLCSTTFGGSTVPPLFGGGGGANPFINSGTLTSPNIVDIGVGVTWSWRQWGRLSDSPGLGLFNGYINFTDNGAGTFPWTQTLNIGLIHYTPRDEYDEDTYWYRVQSVDTLAPVPTVSYSLIVPGVFTPTQSWTVSHTGAAPGGYRTMRLDWSTDLGVSTFAEIFIRFET
jgi:hypothetical protein